MENIITKKSKALKCGAAIKTLSIIALVCTVLSCVTYFFYYDSEKINGEWVYELAVRPLYFLNLSNFLSLALTLAPAILLVLYIFMFHSKLKATALVPIIFAIFAFFTIYRWLILREVLSIFELAIIGCYILAVISALKGFSKKIFIIIPMSICLLYETLNLFDTLKIVDFYIEFSWYLYLFASFMSIIGSIAIYVALLLFGLKNKIPPILSISPKKEKARAEKMSPEQALKLLKDKLELEMISEEEYQAQRDEIISNL